MSAVGDGYSPHALRSERKRAGLSQGHLARMVGSSKSAVAHWEAGASRPSPDNLPRLASVLLRPDWLPDEKPRVAPVASLLQRWRVRREEALRPARGGRISPGTKRSYGAVAAAWETAIRELEGWLKEVAP